MNSEVPHKIFAMSNKLEPNTPDGMLYISIGFIAHVHLD